MIEVRHYATESGRDVVSEWLVDLGDIRARAKVSVRIARLRLATSVIANRSAKECGNCGLIGDRDIGFITR